MVVIFSHINLVTARDTTQKERIAERIPIAAIIQEARADLTPSPPPTHNSERNNNKITLRRQLGRYWHITQLEY